MNWSLTGLSYYPMTCAGTYAASGNGTSLSGVNLNIWHHITYVVQGTTTSFYINGFLIDVQNSASPLTCFSSIMNLYFGGDIGGGIIEYYSGLFDDIGFWTIALTSQEIANLFNGCIASVNSQPTNQTININNNAQFVVNSSDPIAIYQWQTDLGVGFQNLNSVGQYTGTTNDTLTVSNVTMSNNNQAFRCIVSSGSCSDTSNVAVLAVCSNSTTITPQNNSLTTGSTATFTATTSDPNPSFVWQSDFGQGFQTLNNFGNYSGVNTNTLTINNLQLAYHLQQIRAISTSGNCIDTSNIAVINILDTCLVTVYDTLLTTVTDTLVINTQITGINPPNNLNTLKVFPNPASTHITIDYGNFNAMSGYTLTIVNSIGQTVFTTPINQQTSYIDLSTWTGNGIYFVQLIDPQNNTIENRKIVIQ
jgi:hypothetical protein